MGPAPRAGGWKGGRFDFDPWGGANAQRDTQTTELRCHLPRGTGRLRKKARLDCGLPREAGDRQMSVGPMVISPVVRVM